MAWQASAKSCEDCTEMAPPRGTISVRVRYFGFGVVGFVVVLEQQAPQQLPHAQAI
jgi:hypothetical protein